MTNFSEPLSQGDFQHTVCYKFEFDRFQTSFFQGLAK